MNHHQNTKLDLTFWMKTSYEIPAFVIVCNAEGVISPLDNDCA